MSETITSLIEKLEGAEAGSRELDALVSVALKLDCKPNLPDDLHSLRPIRKDDYCAPGTYWFVQRSGMSLRTSEPVTTSLDAALALAERVGVRPYQADASIKGKWSWMVVTESRLGNLEANPYARATAATPALALCAAILRAQSEARV